MVKVFKRSNSPNYYFRVSRNGRDCWMSTGTPIKQEAIKIAEQKRAIMKGLASIDGLYADLTKMIEELPLEQSDSKRQELAKDLLQGKTAKLALSEVWDVWLHSPMKRNPGPRTISDYKTYWARFQKWAKDQGIEYLHEIDDTIAQNYCQNLRKSGFAPRTYNGHLKFLKSAFKALKVPAGLLENVWADIPTLKNETESRRNLTAEEISKICSTAPGALKYMFVIGIFTGMRLGDVCSLKWNNVDLDKGIIEFVPKKTERTGKKVRLPILPQLEAFLHELRAISSSKTYLFPEEHKLYNKDSSIISKRIQKHLRNCGIKTQEQPKKGQRLNAITRVGFHSLRHSFVSILVQSKVPQTAIMALVGHGSSVMTEGYTHLDDEQRREAISGVSKLIKFDNEEAI